MGLWVWVGGWVSEYAWVTVVRVGYRAALRDGGLDTSDDRHKCVVWGGEGGIVKGDRVGVSVLLDGFV
jgi:hypothetical protein